MTSLVIGDMLGSFTYKAAEELFELFTNDREKALKEQKRFNDAQISLEKASITFQQLNYEEEKRKEKEEIEKANVKYESDVTQTTTNENIIGLGLQKPKLSDFYEPSRSMRKYIYMVRVATYGVFGYLGYRVVKKVVS